MRSSPDFAHDCQEYFQIKRPFPFLFSVHIASASFGNDFDSWYMTRIHLTYHRSNDNIDELPFEVHPLFLLDRQVR